MRTLAGAAIRRSAATTIATPTLTMSSCAVATPNGWMSAASRNVNGPIWYCG